MTESKQIGDFIYTDFNTFEIIDIINKDYKIKLIYRNDDKIYYTKDYKDMKFHDKYEIGILNAIKYYESNTEYKHIIIDVIGNIGMCKYNFDNYMKLNPLEQIESIKIISSPENYTANKHKCIESFDKFNDFIRHLGCSFISDKFSTKQMIFLINYYLTDVAKY